MDLKTFPSAGLQDTPETFGSPAVSAYAKSFAGSVTIGSMLVAERLDRRCRDAIITSTTLE